MRVGMKTRVTNVKVKTELGPINLPIAAAREFCGQTSEDPVIQEIQRKVALQLAHIFTVGTEDINADENLAILYYIFGTSPAKSMDDALILYNLFIKAEGFFTTFRL